MKKETRRHVMTPSSPTAMEATERRGGSRSESPRSGDASIASVAAVTQPDPQVPEKPARRRFSADFKLQVLREVDACKGPGEIGAVLRRHGLYSSNLVAWRRDESAVRDGKMTYEESGRLLKFYEEGLGGYTYLE